MNLFDSKKKLGIAGVVMGLVAATLAYFGNPANMAICIACFVRDTAGGALAHNLGLAASGTALNAETGEIVAGAVPPAGKIAAIICIIICFVIAFTNKRSEAK